MNNTKNLANDPVRAGRAALLDLLADLLLHELDAPTAALLGGDPALSTALEPPRSETALRALRAEYARLFLIEVPPYASVYLDAPPIIGGEASLAWERVLAAHRYAPTSLERAAAPDHAGLYLRALAAAERDGAPEVVLREGLRWLPQALTAIGRNDTGGFYAQVTDVASHVLQTCAEAARSPVGVVADEAPPKPEDDSLKEIADWLSTPAWSGWFLSKLTLRQLAKPFGVSIGIVDRDRMLEHVLEASALDNRTSELLDALLKEWQDWQAALEAWRSELGTWATALDPWDARLQHTRALLQSMRTSLTPSA